MDTLAKLMERMNNDKPTFVVTIGDMEYTCNRIPFSRLLSIDEGHDVETELGSYERNQEVIFTVCPMFNDALKQIDMHDDPYKVVGKLLRPMEIMAFYGQILKQYIGQLDKDVTAVKKP